MHPYGSPSPVSPPTCSELAELSREGSDGVPSPLGERARVRGIVYSIRHQS